MEVNSNGDCLNFIDDAFVEIIWKDNGNSNLGTIHEYLLEMGQSDFLADRVALSNMLRRINTIIENHNQSKKRGKK